MYFSFFILFNLISFEFLFFVYLVKHRVILVKLKFVRTIIINSVVTLNFEILIICYITIKILIISLRISKIKYNFLFWKRVIYHLRISRKIINQIAVFYWKLSHEKTLISSYICLFVIFSKIKQKVSPIRIHI